MKCDNGDNILSEFFYAGIIDSESTSEEDQ